MAARSHCLLELVNPAIVYERDRSIVVGGCESSVALLTRRVLFSRIMENFGANLLAKFTEMAFTIDCVGSHRHCSLVLWNRGAKLHPTTLRVVRSVWSRLDSLAPLARA